MDMECFWYFYKYLFEMCRITKCDKAMLQWAHVSLLYSSFTANCCGKNAELSISKNWKFLKGESILGCVACQKALPGVMVLFIEMQRQLKLYQIKRVQTST